MRYSIYIGPMPYHIIKEPKGNYKKFFGHITGSEFLQSVFENHGDPEFDRMRYTINDLLDVEGHSVTEQSLEIAVALGLRVAKHNPNRKVAVVTDNAMIRHLVAVSISVAGQPLEVFENLDDARAWADSL